MESDADWEAGLRRKLSGNIFLQGKQRRRGRQKGLEHLKGFCYSKPRDSNSKDALPTCQDAHKEIQWLFSQFGPDRRRSSELPSLLGFVLEETWEDAENEGSFVIFGEVGRKHAFLLQNMTMNKVNKYVLCFLSALTLHTEYKPCGWKACVQSFNIFLKDSFNIFL